MTSAGASLDSYVPSHWETLDQYRLDKKIGGGRFGTVYHARAGADEFAVKIFFLPPKLRGGDDSTLTLADLMATRGLEHPNLIVNRGGGITEDGLPYMVSDFAPGGSLEQRLKTSGKLDTTEAHRVALGILSALVVAQGEGILHLGVSPANVLFSGDGVAQLSDLGVALSLARMRKRQRRANAARETSTGGISLPRYMAPEQLGGGKKAGPQSDVFSVGLVLYEMLAGEPFVTHTNIGSILMSHKEPQRPLPSWLSGTGMGDVIARATAPKPGDRFADAQEMLRALGGP